MSYVIWTFVKCCLCTVSICWKCLNYSMHTCVDISFSYCKPTNQPFVKIPINNDWLIWVDSKLWFCKNPCFVSRSRPRNSGSCVEVNGCVPTLIAPPTTLCSIYFANLPWGASETSKNSFSQSHKMYIMVVCIIMLKNDTRILL